MRGAAKGLPWLLLSSTLFFNPAAAQERTERANLAPKWATVSIDSVPYDSILAWARSRTYDTSPWYSDRQYLVTRDRGALRVGPMARIAGLLDLHLMTPSSMSQGRFIGRIESEGNVEQMGIVRGTTYVWIDDQDGDGRWRGLLIPDWDRPMQIISPTLDSYDTLAVVRGARPRLVFEAVMDVFQLRGGICRPDLPRGAFWMQDDPAGYDSPERFFGDDGDSGGCYPCDCMICCMFHPLMRELGQPFPEGRLPPGRGVR